MSFLIAKQASEPASGKRRDGYNCAKISISSFAFSFCVLALVVCCSRTLCDTHSFRGANCKSTCRRLRRLGCCISLIGALGGQPTCPPEPTGLLSSVSPALVGRRHLNLSSLRFRRSHLRGGQQQQQRSVVVVVVAQSPMISALSF